MLLTVLQPGLLPCMAFVLTALTGFILLLFSSAAARYNQRILGWSNLLLAACFGLGLYYMIQPEEMDHRWYKLPHILWLINLPLPYLYVRRVYNGKQLSWKDLVHGLPLLLFLIDYLPYFLHPHSIRVTEPMGWSRAHAMIPIWGGWLFPDNFHVPASCLVMALYWILQVHVLVLYKEQQAGTPSMFSRWLTMYTLLQVPMFVPGLKTMVTQIPSPWASMVPPATMSVISCITLLMFPRILYGQFTTPPVIEPPPTPPKLHFTEQSIEAINQQLSELMTSQKPFLDGDYSLQQLAAALNMPPHKLSAFINQITGNNFNDYLNQQRIGYCLQRIEANQTNHLNISGLASLCGFNNRNTFSSAFRKVTGSSPSEYLRNRQR